MLGGLKQNLVHTRTQEKGAVTPQETEPDIPVSVQEALAEAWVYTGLPWGHKEMDKTERLHFTSSNYGGGNEDNVNLLQKIPCRHC